MGRPPLFQFMGLLIAFSMMISRTGFAGELKVGSLPPEAKLDGEDGGKLDGTVWDYKNHFGKIHLIFYVDPDEKGDGEELEDELKAQKFPLDQVGSSAVVNMKATALPNFMIGMTLSSKQKKFPSTTYAKDFTKHMVGEWGLKDDAYNFIILNQKGELLYRKLGKPTPDEIRAIIELIKKNLVVAAEKPKI